MRTNLLLIVAVLVSLLTDSVFAKKPDPVSHSQPTVQTHDARASIDVVSVTTAFVSDWMAIEQRCTLATSAVAIPTENTIARYRVWKIWRVYPKSYGKVHRTPYASSINGYHRLC